MSGAKLLWHSNAPWSPTGYGAQTALFLPHLAERYDLAVSSFYGLEGAPLTWGGVPVLPGLGGTYGNESLPYHARKHFAGEPRGGLIVTLMDVWVLDPQIIGAHKAASWVPVDHEPAPPRVIDYFERSGAVPITMSRFGQEMLAEFDPLYVPHAVDCDVYRPVDKRAARERMGIDPDCFLVGMVAANKGNPSRKSFVAALEAFAAFQREHENARLYLHTDVDGTFSQGVPLLPVMRALGIPPDAVMHTDQYSMHFHPLSPETMACVYSAMDVLLNPAMGEGFGVPILEAQSCGTPVVVTDFSAMREVCGAGWRVSGSRYWTTQGSWQCMPEVSDIVEALGQCLKLPQAARERLSTQAREHALGYDVRKVLEEHMLPALSEAQRRCDERDAPVDLKVRAVA